MRRAQPSGKKRRLKSAAVRATAACGGRARVASPRTRRRSVTRERSYSSYVLVHYFSLVLLTHAVQVLSRDAKTRAASLQSRDSSRRSPYRSLRRRGVEIAGAAAAGRDAGACGLGAAGRGTYRSRAYSVVGRPGTRLVRDARRAPVDASRRETESPRSRCVCRPRRASDHLSPIGSDRGRGSAHRPPSYRVLSVNTGCPAPLQDEDPRPDLLALGSTVRCYAPTCKNLQTGRHGTELCLAAGP